MDRVSLANLVFTDFSGVKHIVASPSDYGLGHQSQKFFGDSPYAYPMGDGHYLIKFDVSDSPANKTDLYYRIFDASSNRFEGSAKFVKSFDGNGLYFGADVQEPGRVLLADYNGYQNGVEITASGHTVIDLSNNPHSGWQYFPYSAGKESYDLNGNWIEPSQANIVFTSLDGVQHVVASPSDLPADYVFTDNTRKSTQPVTEIM